jgi:hypothetical protein
LPIIESPQNPMRSLESSTPTPQAPTPNKTPLHHKKAPAGSSYCNKGIRGSKLRICANVKARDLKDDQPLIITIAIV